MKNIWSSIKNLIIFILLIVISFMIILKNQDISSIINILLNIKAGYALIGLLCMSSYFILEGINFKSILKVLGDKVKLLSAMKYSIISFFFSGITPAASGGQPMAIYTMYKEGIPVPHSTITLLVHLCSFQVITNILGIIGAISNPDILSNGFIYLFIVGLSLNLVALTTMLICLFSNKLAKKIVNLFIKILKTFKYKKIESLKIKINKSLDSYNKSSNYLRKHKDIFIKSTLLVLIQVILYYSIPFWVCKSFSINNCTLWQIISMQALLFSSVSSIPLPGAVGVSEGGFLAVYKKVYGETVLSSAMLLNRFINFYLFILIGMIVVTTAIIKIKKKNDLIDEYQSIDNPQDLLEFMDNNISYGIHGTDGIDYINDGTEKANKKFQKACQKVYALTSPEKLLKNKVGQCWDQVELERDWFLRHGYEYKTLYIMFVLDHPNSYSTHTYLIYKDNNDYCLFEHADYNNRGIHRFSSYEQAIKWQANRHIESNKENGNKITKKELECLRVFEYQNPKYGINMTEFIDFVLSGEDITHYIKED